MYLQVRYTLLKAQLDKVELLESFSEFVEGGIAHLSLQRTTATGETSNANNGEHSEVNDATPALPAAVVEKLKDILYDVEKLKLRLKTGLKDAGTYSTVTEDYIDTD